MRRMAIPHLHPDFGTQYGIPWNVATAATARVPVTFDYADESDRGPYPIGPAPKQENGSDAHVLIVDRDACRLYELYAARRSGDRWHAGSGAIWDLTSNVVRPAGWTSADAAGLPILPGLARADEAASGSIDHAIRFTLPRTQAAYLYPARHLASDVRDPAVAPMGLRLRLKGSFDISRFSAQSRIVLRALRRYGMIVADNGSAGYLTGDPSGTWNDDALHDLHGVPGSAFEVVDTTTLTGTPTPRVWNIATRTSRGRATVRFFLTADARVTVSAVRGSRVVQSVSLTARQGLVGVRIRAVKGARYQVRAIRQTPSTR